jgi:hypothetical protein
LPLTERRRLAALTERHARDWLGPLAELADVAASRFEGGFLAHLACQPQVPASAWGRLAGEPRLATLLELTLPAASAGPQLAAFVRHPVLRSLRRLHASAAGWASLDTSGLRLDVVSLGSWGVFRGELAAVRGQQARCLELVTSEFVNPLVAAEVRESLVTEQAMLGTFAEVALVVQFGVFEGAAAWLVRAARDGLLAAWPGTAVGVVHGDTRFTLSRDGGAFSALGVDLSFGGDLARVGQRVANAVSVLVQLAPARLERVEVTLPPGARLRAAERYALRSAARRLGTIKALSLGGAALPLD